MKYLTNKKRLQEEFKKDSSWLFTRNRLLAPILDYIHYNAVKYNRYHISQDALAAHVGCTTKTIQKHIKIAQKHGLLTHWQRFNDTCKYQLHSLFKDQSLRSKLIDFMPSLRYLFVPLLLTALFSLPSPIRFLSNKDINLVSLTTKRVASSKVIFGYDPGLGYKILEKEKLFRRKRLKHENDSQPNYSQKQESPSKVSTVPAKNVPEFNIVNYAKRIWEEEVIKKNKSQYYYKQALRRKLKDFPKTEFALKIWYNSTEATHIREWLNAKDLL